MYVDCRDTLCVCVCAIMVRILAIGDPHFKVDNTEESEHFHLQVHNWLVSNRDVVDFIVILGDILHSHEKIFTFAMNTAVRFIKMCSSFATTYCLVGNHDATSNTFFCGSNHWLNVLDDMQNVVVVDRPKFVKGTNKILCCPYVSDGRFYEMLQTYQPEWRNYTKLIFAHQLFDGAHMASIVAEGVEQYDLNDPVLISGHIHDRHQPQPNLYYTGSSQQLAFNEKGDKSIAVVELKDDKVTWNEIYLQLKQRKTIYTSVADVDKIQWVSGVVYKVVIRDEECNIKVFKKSAKLKELEQRECVRSVQFKIEVRSDDEMKDAEGTDCIDFLSLLMSKVEGDGDPYMKSYAKHLLLGSEDQSDKDVVLV